MNKIAQRKGIRIAGRTEYSWENFIEFRPNCSVLAPQYDLAENMKKILRK